MSNNKTREFEVVKAWIDDGGLHIEPTGEKVTMTEVDNSKDIYYISGKISGLPIEEAEKNFFKAQQDIRERFPGAGFVNPMGIYLGANGSWEKYMEIDLEWLEKYANAIYMLDNYKSSKGANMELERAKELGYKIEYQ